MKKQAALKRRYLKINAAECSTCGRCVLACVKTHYGEISTGKSAIKVIPDYPCSLKVSIRACTQCWQEFCVKACPTGALYRCEENYVELDRSRCGVCSGVFPCVSACKSKLIFQHPASIYPLKCNLCGGDPECIKECLPNVLTVEEKERKDASQDSFGSAAQGCGK